MYLPPIRPTESSSRMWDDYCANSYLSSSSTFLFTRPLSVVQCNLMPKLSEFTQSELVYICFHQLNVHWNSNIVNCGIPVLFNAYRLSLSALAQVKYDPFCFLCSVSPILPPGIGQYEAHCSWKPYEIAAKAIFHWMDATEIGTGPLTFQWSALPFSGN